MGELQGVRAGKADAGAEGRNVPEMPPAGDGHAGQPAADPVNREPRGRKVWVAFNPDGSDLVLFGREIDGYRYASENGMRCKAVEYGVPVMEQIGTS